ncbi:MAG: hypothetical protein KKF78_04770 [Candidatus Omnitrophica bacterium]|nr:hypothetical protein [Candidatus Omnitrophota bacterium]MBU1996452.1 hypothetical protein [Candidatus Omnitrophota bacterium]
MTIITANIWYFVGSFVFIVFGVLIFLYIGKDEQVKELTGLITKLKKSFNDLDEQAKLIVKTDLELNKAQEELDKRLNGLDALQNTSQLISTSLNENEIFAKLDQTFLMDIGFEKTLILKYDKNNILYDRSEIGFTPQEKAAILEYLANDSELINLLKRGKKISSENSTKLQKETIARIFNVEHYILTPIMSPNGMIGIIFVGNTAETSSMTEGDEEIISILATQIAQALDNARLFEEVYRSRQALESKVQSRTIQLESALEQVQNISKTKSEFISAVSHELRTPLTSIKGYASILMAGKLGEVPENVKLRLAKINTHSDNLVNLINELLDISRIESGRVEMKFNECDISRMIESVHDLLTPQLKDKRINWVTELAPNVPKLFLDTSHFERVFINLVSNAIKFTPEEGTISITASLNDDIVTVGVSDTGIGISEQDIKRLFDEFYRVENKINQNVKGTGLGLALAKKIVEAHKGRIWITSEIGKGTTFHFTIPV